MVSPLKITNLVKNYGALCAVKDVSFSLREGEIFGLLGPNGAGKTSIISCLSTLEKPSFGTIEVFGVNVEKDHKKAKRLMGIVPQEIINHGFFTVREILKYYSGFLGVWADKDYLNSLLRQVGLYEHRNKRVRQLSGGMRRRLLLVKALSHKPKLLVLDEPTAGVDLELREALYVLIKDLRSQGVTTLLTTHYLEEAEALCDRIAIINKGQIQKAGETTKLISDVTDREVSFRFLGDRQFHHPFLLDQKGDLKYFRLPYATSLYDLFKDLDIDLEQVRDLKIKEGSLEAVLRHVLNREVDSLVHTN